MKENKIIIAVPKGRILEELLPLLSKINIIPESSFFDKNSRQLSFLTNHTNIILIRVRSFDVPTFVTYGAAHIGVAGSDALQEFDYPDIYSPLDLKIGKCRMSLAAPIELLSDNDLWNQSHILVATKYINITKDFFAKHGLQAECIKLNGAIELAPKLGLCRRIVDLVSTGSTLKANGLVEVEKILDVSSRLIINRIALKTAPNEINKIINDFSGAMNG